MQSPQTTHTRQELREPPIPPPYQNGELNGHKRHQRSYSTPPLLKRSWFMLGMVLLDFLLSYGVWMAFWSIRKLYIEDNLRWAPFEVTPLLLVKAGIVSLGWLGLFWAAGLYRDMLQRSRLRDLAILLQMSLVGVVVVSFATFLNDPIGDPIVLRKMVLYYFLMQFLTLGLVHMIILTVIKHLMVAGKLGFNTLIIGSGDVAYRLWREMQNPLRAPGYRVKGFLSLPNNGPNRFYGKLKHYGTIERLSEVVRSRRIEEVIIALDKNDHERFLEILRACKPEKVRLSVVPDMYDILVGNVKFGNIYGAPLMEISPHLIAPWERLAKRALDILVSLGALVLGAPLFAVLGAAIRLDSRGPIFYRQERMGQGGQPFQIIKFRSMYIDAEKKGPSLSSAYDPRITQVGRFLRKTHLDELPQFWNVLRGDMTLVGPRPERQYFIEQISARAPEYEKLLNVKPGLTGWGQVQYGYAENVDEMIDRMKYDLLYIENMSLQLDLKILAYTFLRVVQGDGK
jgi:exopolysaccharide biosynthesis polyprenyl glycosylphosphotransferase